MKTINIILAALTVFCLGFGLGVLAKNIEEKLGDNNKAISTQNCTK